MSNRGLRRDRIGGCGVAETLPHARSRVSVAFRLYLGRGDSDSSIERGSCPARRITGDPPGSGYEWCDGDSPASRPQAEEIPESARLVPSVHEFRSRE